jgi:hypothetical protein
MPRYVCAAHAVFRKDGSPFAGHAPGSTSSGFFGGRLRWRSLRRGRRALDRYQAAPGKAIHAGPGACEVSEHEGALAPSGRTKLHLRDGSCPMNDVTLRHLQRDAAWQQRLRLRLARHGSGLRRRERWRGALALRSNEIRGCHCSRTAPAPSLYGRVRILRQAIRLGSKREIVETEVGGARANKGSERDHCGRGGTHSILSLPRQPHHSHRGPGS